MKETNQFQIFNHPLFGEIQVSQSENGNTLYRAATVAEHIGISDYKSYVGKNIKSYSIKIAKVNGLGYTTKMPIKFVDEDGIRSMLLIVCEQKIHRAMKNYKTLLRKI